MPVFRLGRLAVSVALQGRGLGGDLLLSAGVRALSVASQIGGVALAIDAKDERAAKWYERFGSLRLLDDPLELDPARHRGPAHAQARAVGRCGHAATTAPEAEPSRARTDRAGWELPV